MAKRKILGEENDILINYTATSATSEASGMVDAAGIDVGLWDPQVLGKQYNVDK